MLKAVFRMDSSLSSGFDISITTDIDKKLLLGIEFDTGDTYTIISNTNTKNKFKEFFDIPTNASKVTITSDNDIISFILTKGRHSIISIEELTSDTITDCSYMFIDFINLKEIKNINLNWDKITSATYMCGDWYSFNGILPKDFCSNMTSLTSAYGMFSEWHSFNEKLPDNFCSNMSSLKYGELMFSNWKTFNQKLPDGFCNNMNSLKITSSMFYNWLSYSHNLPDTFFPDTSYIEYNFLMFHRWYNCYNTPKYDLPEYTYDYKQKDIDELNYLLEKHKEQIIDYKLMSKLANKEFCLCVKGNIDHYILIKNDYIKCFYNNFDNHLGLVIQIQNDTVITIT